MRIFPKVGEFHDRYEALEACRTMATSGGPDSFALATFGRAISPLSTGVEFIFAKQTGSVYSSLRGDRGSYRRTHPDHPCPLGDWPDEVQ